MNIEQIKKDWEQHCKKYKSKYGYVGVKEKFLLTLNDDVTMNQIIFRKMTSDDYCIQLMLDNYSKETHKLFTTFYEKLMKE